MDIIEALAEELHIKKSQAEAAVGLIDSWQTIREAWVSYVVITAVSTVAVMAVSGRAVQAVMKRSKKKEEAG